MSVGDGRVLIIGGGVIGLSIGWELVRRGRAVTILERDVAGRGTSWLAAGMLAPDAEIGFEELELYRLNRESLQRWPDFARDLEEASGKTIGYDTKGTLIVADDRDSAEALRRLYDFQREQGLSVEWLSGEEALEVEPFLAPRLTAAVYAPSDHQVENRLLLEALRRVFESAGGDLREQTAVATVEPHPDRPAVVTEERERIEGAAVVVAAGVWTGHIEGLTTARPSVRPVKGQMIELRIERPFGLEHVVRGPEAYLVPKPTGRLLVGATSEEMGFDTDVTAGGLHELLEGGWEVVPGIADLTVTATWAGLRPASLDHAPLLGAGEEPGVIYATGHYRHGILLAPLTAQAIARLICEGETSSCIRPFVPTRFGDQQRTSQE